MMLTTKGPLRVLALAALLGAVSTDAAEAATKVSECRKIKKSGSYVLTRNLPGPNGLRVNGNCLAIAANHVTLDLAGYEIKGNGLGDPVKGDGIFMQDRKNVTIMNGTVRGFLDEGIADANSESTGTGRNHRITNVRVLNNGGAGILLNGTGHSVTNSHAEGNDGSGINVQEDSTLDGNTAVGNGGDGMVAGGGTSVRNNTSNINAGAGISLGGNNLVDGNSAVNNAGGGITNCGTCTYGVNLGVDSP